MLNAEAREQGRAGRFLAWLTSFDDGLLMRSMFFGLLAGTTGVLVIDYLELAEKNATAPQYEPMDQPILPAIERPEIDPDSPSFAPHTRITTPPETLGEPMSISLGANGVLKLEGAITLGSAETLKDEFEARGEYIETIALNSPGGVVQEALAMGRIIREHAAATEVAAGALCASSCPLLLAAGTDRIAYPDSIVGVHQIYAASGGPGAPGSAQAMSDAQTTTAQITRYLRDMEVDPALWLHALETPPDKLYYFTPEELETFKLASMAGK